MSGFDSEGAPLAAATSDDRSFDRRRALGLLGSAGAVAVVAGCSRPPVPPPTGGGGGPSNPACPLTPEQTEGPYYLDGEAVRSDITEGRPGAALQLDLRVVDAATCAPIAGVPVDIWHADAQGTYSGFGAATANRTFLRGVQVTDADGRVTFRTIYPGWYVGRTTHIHVKVHLGGTSEHTGQLYFDEAVSDQVFATAAYAGRRGSRTRNAGDMIYRQGGAQSMVAVTAQGPGYRGDKTLAVTR
jgi:protocatechuate 3,4-dioxygenase beta subunit